MQQQRQSRVFSGPQQACSSRDSSRTFSSSSSSRNASSRLSSSRRLLVLLALCVACSMVPAGAAARELTAAKAKTCKPACASSKICISGVCKSCINSGQCKQALGPNFKCDKARGSKTKGQCVLPAASKPQKPVPMQPSSAPESPKCLRDSQCSSEPLHKTCDVASGKCVQCTAASHCSLLVQADNSLSTFTCANNLCIKVAQPLPGPTDGGSDSSGGSGSSSSGTDDTPHESPPPESTQPPPAESTPPPPPESTQPPPPSTQPPPPAPVTPPVDPAAGDDVRECTTNADCPRRVSWDLSRGPSCSLEGKCTQCNADDDCPARGLICSGKCDVCVEHTCVACRVDDDCGSASGIEGQGPYCMAGSCEVKGKACTTDEECTPAWPICSTSNCPTPKCVNSFCDSGLQGLRKRAFYLY